MFIAWFSAHHIYIDRIMSSQSAKVLKGDHTYKAVDHQGRLPGGEPIHEAMYSLVNEDEEVRAYGLTLTQSFSPLTGLYKHMQIELPRHGYGPTQILYTDNPRAERNWHEKTTPALAHNVQHIILDPFRDLPAFTSSVLPHFFLNSSNQIDTICNDLLGLIPTSEPLLIAIAVKYSDQKIHLLQLRTVQNIYIFELGFISAPLHIPPCLKSLLTNPRIIKVGHRIRLAVKQLSKLWNISFPDRSLVDIGRIAKLKGMVKDPSSSLRTLAGSVLTHVIPEPDGNCSWEGDISDETIKELNREVDCVWILNAELMRRGSVGLPLQDNQVQPGQLVSLVISQREMARGKLVAHDGHWSVPGVVGNTKITPAYTVIQLTDVLFPSFLVSKHKQTLQWLLDHVDPPLPATDDSSLGIPAPLDIPLSQPEMVPAANFTTAISASQVDEQPEDPVIDSDLDLDDDDLDPMEDDCKAMVINAIRHARGLIHQAPDSSSDPLVTRVLNDAYHFMDRLLRLLPKKHSAFKEFAHQFSETIFIRDQNDEQKVRDVLKEKGISRDYAVRTKKAALHRRIRRYIPRPEDLENNLRILFQSFADIQDSVDHKTGCGKLFSPLARKQADTLLETVHLGFLSDPPHIALYYIMGTDRDGLNLYRTVRGTNSVEGGVHMLVRRISGSLQASLTLTEAILGNWFNCRNRRIGHHNRTGKKWTQHFDIWLLNDIVEAAIEFFGVLPITPEVAEEAAIVCLPTVDVVNAPHHHDTTSYALSRFSTKFVNLYRYLQLRQRTIAPVIPVHTQPEFVLFKDIVTGFISAPLTSSPEDVYKYTNYIEFAKFWNRKVVAQSATILDTGARIYFKLPEQLLRHHKKSLQWKTSRATLTLGSNVEALEPLRNMLGDPSRKAIVLPAITLEPEQVDFALSAAVGVDLQSFNPMALRQQREINGKAKPDSQIPAHDEEEDAPEVALPVQITQPTSQPSHAQPQQQLILSFTLQPIQSTSSSTMELVHPAKKPKLSAPGKRKGRTCALCEHAKCASAEICAGCGNRELYGHKTDPLHAEMGLDKATRRRGGH
ncbi:hypothetical protein B0H19DRAFT_1266182 [Mycena capillaripes]|nr:hypothetical protein B0H19DRAFT_1266182 [Mycena capillaripes]